MMDYIDLIKNDFPNLSDENYEITSEPTRKYNCIAWAAKDVEKLWWPIKDYPFIYWPPECPREETIDAFIKAFSTKGYIVCDSENMNKDNKLVIYCDKNNKPTHMARQLPDGWWTSKLGPGHDIKHKYPEDLISDIYGTPTVYLIRSDSI